MSKRNKKKKQQDQFKFPASPPEMLARMQQIMSDPASALAHSMSAFLGAQPDMLGVCRELTQILGTVLTDIPDKSWQLLVDNRHALCRCSNPDCKVGPLYATVVAALDTVRETMSEYYQENRK